MNGMIEVARSSVQTWECDQMGHMNVQFYLDKADQGLTTLALELGLGPTQARSSGVMLRAREHHVRFLREQRPGAPFFLRGGLVDVGESGLTVYQEMVETVSDTAAATFLIDVECVDIASRTPQPLSEALRAYSEQRVEVPVHGRPRGLELAPPRPAPTLADAERSGMLRTWQGAISRDQCDDAGFLTVRHFMGIVSDSIPNLLALTGGSDRSKTPGVGGAALEYRFVYRGQPRVGDVLTLRSGLKQVGSKAYTWCHWLFDLETGTAVATAEAVAIAMDLEARRAIPIPEAMRANLEARVIPGLGV
ncbi:MAG: thioesterase [Gammaproteobacteria bacterium]|nr:MAG: thioesterase [Gammaproteobacteria bacterium]